MNEEKSKRFTKQNTWAPLDSLKLPITEIQMKIKDTYVKEGNERSASGVERPKVCPTIGAVARTMVRYLSETPPPLSGLQA
jgi:hypothetical protein